MHRDLVLLIAFYGLYVVWVLIPLIPAVIIYLLFPNSPTATQWKISGVALKAGGASGFYFAILALAYFNFVSPVTDYIKSLHKPYWTVDAPITFLEAVTPIVGSEQLRVEPFAYEFRRTDEKSYLVTLKFPERDGELPKYVRLIFPDGEGYIDLGKLRTNANTNSFSKTIDLTSIDPIKIRPPLHGGQNKPAIVGLPTQVEYALESNDQRK